MHHSYGYFVSHAIPATHSHMAQALVRSEESSSDLGLHFHKVCGLVRDRLKQRMVENEAAEAGILIDSLKYG